MAYFSIISGERRDCLALSNLIHYKTNVLIHHNCREIGGGTTET